MTNHVLELTAATFDDEIGGSTLPVLVEFWAEWCPPCKVMGPVLDAIAAEYAQRMRVSKINADEHPGLASRFGVMSVPTMLVFARGDLLHRMVGSRSRGRLLDEVGRVLSL